MGSMTPQESLARTSAGPEVRTRALGRPKSLLFLVILPVFGIISLIAAAVFTAVPLFMLIGQGALLLLLLVLGLVLSGHWTEEVKARERAEAAIAQNEESQRRLEQRIKELEEMAMYDSLTGLWNFHYLQVQLPREVSRVKRRNIPLSLIMVDVDGLKKVNDGYGHDTGNVLLKDISSMLKESLRISDTVGRWGGDEFLALLPEAGKADALAVAKRIKFRLEQYRLKANGEAIPVSISMGVATFPVDGEDADDLFKKADSAMYLGKQRGGNQVSVYAGPAGGKRKLLGEYLMERGVCTTEQLEEAIRYCLEASKRGEFLAVGEALAKLGYATDEEVQDGLSSQAKDRGLSTA